MKNGTLKKNKGILSQLRNERGFTLLELLTVVAIIAIIGGGMIAAYDGLEGQAATGGATGSLAALDQAVRTFNVTEGNLPNNLESLMSVPVTGAGTCTAGDTTLALADITQASVAKAQMLTGKLAGKFDIAALTDAEYANLAAAGITQIRFLDQAAEAGTHDTLIADANCADAQISGAVSAISIPQHAFESPRPGGLSNTPPGRNRGRGAAVAMGTTAATSPNLMVWNSGGLHGYNNVKVGGSSTSKLVGLGIGNASTLVGSATFTNLAHAPYYGKTLKNEYNHYVMLVDVTQDPARFVAMVDSRGDFLDEEYAESTGQKR